MDDLVSTLISTRCLKTELSELKYSHKTRHCRLVFFTCVLILHTPDTLCTVNYYHTINYYHHGFNHIGNFIMGIPKFCSFNYSVHSD